MRLDQTYQNINKVINTPFQNVTWTGAVVVDSSTGAVTVTGQVGQIMSNLKIGTLATMNYTVIS